MSIRDFFQQHLTDPKLFYISVLYGVCKNKPIRNCITAMYFHWLSLNHCEINYFIYYFIYLIYIIISYISFIIYFVASRVGPRAVGTERVSDNERHLHTTPHGQLLYINIIKHIIKSRPGSLSSLNVVTPFYYSGDPWDSRQVWHAGGTYHHSRHRPHSVPTAFGPALLATYFFFVLCLISHTVFHHFKQTITFTMCFCMFFFPLGP